MSANRLTAGTGYLQSTNTVAHGIGTGDFTLMGWHKWKSGTETANARSCCSFRDDGFLGFTIEPGNGLATYTWRHTEYGQTARVFGTWTADVWVHACVVRSGGTLSGYYNAVLDSNTFVESNNTIDGKATLMSRNNAGLHPAIGLYFDWALWDVALSEAEIQSVKTQGKLISTLVTAGTIATAPFVGWKLSQTTGGTILDGDVGLQDWTGGANHLVTANASGSVEWTADEPFSTNPDTRHNRSGRLLRPHLYRPEYYRPRQSLLVEDEG